MIKLNIESTAKNYQREFSSCLSVANAIDKVREDIGYVKYGHYSLVKRNLDVGADDILSPVKSLDECGIKEGDTLVFVDWGDAV